MKFSLPIGAIDTLLLISFLFISSSYMPLVESVDACMSRKDQLDEHAQYT